jgi:hypothetical protein
MMAGDRRNKALTRRADMADTARELVVLITHGMKSGFDLAAEIFAFLQNLFSQVFEKAAAAIQHWPVAVILIALVFRKNLVQLFDSATKLMNDGKFKKLKLSQIEIEFAETAIGKIQKSPNISSFEFITDSITYNNRIFHFTISYPLKSQSPTVLVPQVDWYAIEQTRKVSGPLCYFLVQFNSGKSFVPNINVRVGRFGGTILEYNSRSLDELIRAGMEIQSTIIDAKNNTSLFEFNSTWIKNAEKSEEKRIGTPVRDAADLQLRLALLRSAKSPNSPCRARAAR